MLEILFSCKHVELLALTPERVLTVESSALCSSCEPEYVSVEDDDPRFDCADDCSCYYCMTWDALLDKECEVCKRGDCQGRHTPVDDDFNRGDSVYSDAELRGEVIIDNDDPVDTDMYEERKHFLNELYRLHPESPGRKE